MRRCKGCGEPLVRRRTETQRQFAARRFCARACFHAWRRGRPTPHSSPEGVSHVPCSAQECGRTVAVSASRRRHSRSGRFYCSTSCQATDRRRGGPLAARPVSPAHLAIADDARTGHYTLRELAERHGRREDTVAVILHRLGVSLREVRREARPS